MTTLISVQKITKTWTALIEQDRERLVYFDNNNKNKACQSHGRRERKYLNSTLIHKDRANTLNYFALDLVNLPKEH